MSEAPIPGGYILLSRKIIESEIWSKPPLYLKVWIWLLERAQHKEFKQLKRGQLYTSIEEIQNEVSWKVGFRKVKPSRDQIYQVIDWMRTADGRNFRKRDEGVHGSNTRATMIATAKATHGILVNIDNYCFYQNPINYEGNGESNDEKVMKPVREQWQPSNINKNDNNTYTYTDNKRTPFEFSPGIFLTHEELNQFTSKCGKGLSYMRFMNTLKRRKMDGYKPTGTDFEELLKIYAEENEK